MSTRPSNAGATRGSQPATQQMQPHVGTVPHSGTSNAGATTGNQPATQQMQPHVGTVPHSGTSNAGATTGNQPAAQLMQPSTGTDTHNGTSNAGAATQKKRNRFSNKERAAFKTAIAEAILKKESLLLLRMKLGLSKTQFKNLIADMALNNNLTLKDYFDSVAPSAMLLQSLVHYFDIKDLEQSLFQLIPHENGILVTPITLG